MANEIQLTPEGLEKLQKELEELRGPVRSLIAEAIREAKSHGDLKENAAYHEAKLNQTRLESRIADIERAVQIAKVVYRPDIAGDIAHLGSIVKLLDLDYDDELTIKLVGNYEADPASDLVSISSPLGEALLSKKLGDEITVQAPGGTTTYRVVGVA